MENIAPRPRWRDRLWNPYVIVFLSSGSIMVLELVASRMLAPTIGVSLYTWTSVIAVILAGISLGNYLGGRLADRYGSVPFLGLIFFLASLGSLSTLWLTDLLGGFSLPQGVPLAAWIVLYVAVIFFLPGVLLGCISPIVVKLSLTDLQRSGTTVGKIYAWSTAGSILGTLATGFWLVAWLGTRSIVLYVAGLLMLMAIWFLTDTRPRRAVVSGVGAAALFALLLGLLYRGGALQSGCLRESNYFCIKVHEREVGERTIRELVLDRLVHSYTDLDDPTYLHYGYERTYAAVVEPMMERRPDLAAFFIGGGGYTFPRYMETLLPEAHIVVSEIDPEVTETAHDLLGLPRDTDMEIHHLDARILLTLQGEQDTYDLVFGDAFNDYSVPYHLTTIEFSRMIDEILRDGGLYVVNIVDGGQRGHFMRAYVRTLQEVFAHVMVIPSSSGWRDSTRTTFVIVASQEPFDLSHLPTHERPLSEQELEEYLDLDPPLILHDDFVPVDNLLAPVFEDSFRG